MISGIYKIFNKKTNKCYIGQSKDIHKRISNHKYCLYKNKHLNKHLQRAWNKYGSNSFEFEILEFCTEDLLNKKEKEYIEKYDSYKHGYNSTKGGKDGDGNNVAEHNRKVKKYDIYSRICFGISFIELSRKTNRTSEEEEYFKKYRKRYFN